MPYSPPRIDEIRVTDTAHHNALLGNCDVYRHRSRVTYYLNRENAFIGLETLCASTEPRRPYATNGHQLQHPPTRAPQGVRRAARSVRECRRLKLFICCFSHGSWDCSTPSQVVRPSPRAANPKVIIK